MKCFALRSVPRVIQEIFGTKCETRIGIIGGVKNHPSGDLGEEEPSSLGNSTFRDDNGDSALPKLGIQLVAGF